MSGAGKKLLGLALMGKPGADDEAPDSEESEPHDGMLAGAEDLCAACGIDKEKAPDVAAAIGRMIDIHNGK